MSSKLEARPLNTADGSGPAVPGVRSISIALVSGDAVHVSVAVPSSQSNPTLLIVGGVASYLNAGDVPPARLPALSVQVPLTVVLFVSAPGYVTSVHAAMPVPPSLPWKVTRPGWLYQPLLSGERPHVRLSAE